MHSSRKDASTMHRLEKLCLSQARVQAAQAAEAGQKAAEFALRAVEGGIDHYARSKNFEKLKEIAEASGVATKVGLL